MQEMPCPPVIQAALEEIIGAELPSEGFTFGDALALGQHLAAFGIVKGKPTYRG